MVYGGLSLFRASRPAIRHYVGGTVLAALVAWYLALGPVATELGLLASAGFVFVLLLNLVAEATFVTLPSGAKIAASFLVLLISLFLFSPAITAIVAASGTAFSVCARQRRHWSIAAFNAGQYTLAYVSAGAAIHLFGPEPLHLNLLPLFWAAGLASLTYLLVSSATVNGYIALKTGQNLFKLIWEEDRWEWLQVVIMWPIAVLALSLWPTAGWMAVIVPFALTLIFIDAMKAFIATQQHNKQLEQLQAITRLVGGARDVDSIWRTLSQQLPKLFPHERFDVYSVSDAKQRLERAASDMIGMPEESYDLLDLDAPLQKAVANRQVMRVDDLGERNPYGETWVNIRAVLAVPVTVANDVRWLLVLTAASPNTFTKAHEYPLKLLVNQIEVSLENVQLNESIQQQALTDPLTGRYNRRYLNKKIDDELRRAMRHKRPTSLLIIDVDYFKRFNDTHGHLLGDAVLRGLGGLLMECVRETDVVARFGGEEFAIFLPETSLEQGTEVAERVRTRVAGFPFTGRNGQPVHITLSIGASCTVDASMTREELCENADTALYRAKRQGRNQICQALASEGKQVTLGPAQDADRAMSTGHRVDPALLQKWAQQLRLGAETIGRQWLDAIERYPTSNDRPILDSAHVRAIVEQSSELMAERLLLLARRPDEADRPFSHQGPLFDQLRKEASRAAHHPQAIVRLETGLMLLQGTMQTFCSGFDGDRSLLRLLIDRLMIAAHGTVTDTWVEQLSQIQRDMQSLLRSVQKLNRLNDPDGLPDMAASLFVESLKCEGAVLVDTDGDELVVRGQSGGITPAPGARLSRLPMEGVRRVGSPCALTSPWEDYPGEVLAAPVMLPQGRSLLIGWSHSPRHFRLEELRLAEDIAAQVVATHERLMPWDRLPLGCESDETEGEALSEPANGAHTGPFATDPTP